MVFLTEYEKLLSTATDNNVAVYDNYNLKGTKIKGLYCDGTVALSNELDTQSEKACVLAEELGHYHTSSGNIIDMSNTINCQQELKARLWAYNNRVGLQGIIDCYKSRCLTINEMSEHLEVTEEFLKDAIACYRSKYNVYTQLDNYIIVFEPTLYVIELFN